MRRGPALLTILLFAAGCAKRADEAATAPASQAAPVAQPPGAAPEEVPAPEPAPATDEEAPSSATPPKAQAGPTGGVEGEAKKGRGRDALKSKEDERDDGFTTLASAEAAFAKAKSELETLVVVGGKAVALSTGDAKCERACKAFSSLERAASGICRIAGESDARCTKARGVVTEHRPRVAACGCDDD